MLDNNNMVYENKKYIISLFVFTKFAYYFWITKKRSIDNVLMRNMCTDINQEHNHLLQYMIRININLA